METEWDFKRQWELFWSPAIERALPSQPTPSRARVKTVSAIIVSRNEGAYLKRTVESLRRTLSAKDEIIVVDDQSTDGSTAPEQFDGGVRVMRPPERLGVAASRNYGARHASGDVLVFSDAHVEVPRDWVAPVIEALSVPDAGAASAALTNLHHPAGKGVCGGRWRSTGGDHLAFQWLPSQDKDSYPVPLLSGGFLAMSRRVFDATDGFDAGMWMYGVEDTELSVRLWTSGYQCLAVPKVVVAHRFNRPASSGGCDYKRPDIHLHNKLRLAVLHFCAERMARMVAAFAKNPQFPAAFARLLEGDAWSRKRELQAVRKYDDNWYFQHFQMPL
jgi:GT2 family glycosyltransferase